MQALIDTANSGFSSTTGMTISDVVTWGTTNLFQVFIGTGLALLYDFRYWIVLLVVVGVVIAFGFRGFHTKKS